MIDLIDKYINHHKFNNCNDLKYFFMSIIEKKWSSSIINRIQYIYNNDDLKNIIYQVFKDNKDFQENILNISYLQES